MKPFVLHIALLLALFSCARSSRTEIVIGVEKLPLTLDPRFGIDTASENATALIYRGLMKLNAKLEPLPDLAESVEVKDASTYLFTLSGDTSPKEVVSYYEYLRDEKNASPYRSVFGKIKRVEQVGERKVKVELSEPNSFFLVAARRPIVPMAVLEKLGKSVNKEGSSSRFFKVVVKENAGVILGDENRIYVKLKPILDPTLRLLALSKGDVDVVQFTADGFPTGSIERLKKDSTVKIQTTPSLNIQYLNFNLRHPILKKLLVRKAIAHAIDRRALIQFKLGGYGRVATGFLPPSHWAYEPNVKTYDYNPELAKTFLDQAGYRDADGEGPKKRFEIIYKTSTNPQSIETAEVIKRELEAVGIGVELRSNEFGVLFDDVKKGNFDLYSMQWTAIASPDHYYEVFHSRSVPPDGFNRNFYSNTTLDQLLEAGRREVGREKQKKIYSEVQKRVAEDLPSLPLWYPDQIAVTRASLEGYTIDASGTYNGILKARLVP